MKLIAKPIVYPQILRLLIGIVLTCFLHHLQLSHIVEHGMSTCVNRMPHDHMIRILSDVAPVELLKMRWNIWAST